jgi:hypothetical protein
MAKSETLSETRQKAELCDKQFHMYVWTKEPFFYAVAQARTVDEARTLMLEEVGSGDGSCPEREKAAKWIREQQPYIFHRENATFALTDSAEQIEQMAYIEKLQKELKEASSAGRLQGLEEARELIEVSRAIICKVRLSLGDELRVKLLEKMDFWLMEHDEAIREKANG